jgi:hypothetical protein
VLQIFTMGAFLKPLTVRRSPYRSGLYSFAIGINAYYHLNLFLYPTDTSIIQCSHRENLQHFLVLLHPNHGQHIEYISHKPLYIYIYIYIVVCKCCLVINFGKSHREQFHSNLSGVTMNNNFRQTFTIYACFLMLTASIAVQIIRALCAS